MKNIIVILLMMVGSLFAQSDSTILDKIGIAINIEQDVDQYRYINFRAGYYDAFSAFAFVTNTELIGIGFGKDNLEIYGFVGEEKYYGFGINYSTSVGQLSRLLIRR